jgi:integrase
LRALEIAPSHYRHIRAYVDDLLVPHFQVRDVREIGKREVLEFKAAIQDRYSLKSLKNIMSCLHSMLTYWHDLELIEKVPAFPTFRVPEPDWGWLDEETQVKILAKVPEADKPIFYFIAFQGVRPSEARALQWRDLDLKGDMVTIRRTFSQSELRCPKGKRMRTLPLDPEVKEWLSKLERPLDPEQFVFLRHGRRYSEGWCRTLWNRICAELGVKGVTFYGGTRHSLASQFVSDGGSILDIKEFLGHQNISTTLRYAHSDLRAKRRVIARRARILEFKKGEASK